MAEDSDQDKQHEPTERKLEKSRQQGELPRSADLTTAAAYGGFLAFGILFGGGALRDISGTLARLLEHAADIETSGSAAASVWTAILDLSGPFLLALMLPAALVVAAVSLQRAWVFAPAKLEPKLSRISLVQNAKQKFGPDGLFEFAKSAMKLALFCVCLAIFLVDRLPEMIVQIAASERTVVRRILSDVMAFLTVVVVIALGIGAVDFLWHRASHMRRNRMSRKELTDEMKESEGDPHIRQQRRQRGHDIATNRMLSDVPTADVVIVNPTHFAVALKWSRDRGSAPVCVAKGTDEIALRIRSRASEAGVPIRRDPATARALHATVGIGEEILPEHYRPVAAAIRFAEAMRRRARTTGGR